MASVLSPTVAVITPPTTLNAEKALPSLPFELILEIMTSLLPSDPTELIPPSNEAAQLILTFSLVCRGAHRVAVAKLQQQCVVITSLNRLIRFNKCLDIFEQSAMSLPSVFANIHTLCYSTNLMPDLNAVHINADHRVLDSIMRSICHRCPLQRFMLYDSIVNPLHMLDDLQALVNLQTLVMPISEGLNPFIDNLSLPLELLRAAKWLWNNNVDLGRSLSPHYPDWIPWETLDISRFHDTITFISKPSNHRMRIDRPLRPLMPLFIRTALTVFDTATLVSTDLIWHENVWHEGRTLRHPGMPKPRGLRDEEDVRPILDGWVEGTVEYSLVVTFYDVFKNQKMMADIADVNYR
ncbi:hypothetical protein F5Y18DRAFT_374145 [Xylariaceae sp. FL1019]|nr:hypothetical protein F5Y18DRAFT_374145 [Xylariaceae sp. FL1019]